jgi:hypothetical protein
MIAVAGILGEAENSFLVYILRSAKPMLGMKGERCALLPLAIPAGIAVAVISFRKDFFTAEQSPHLTRGVGFH